MSLRQCHCRQSSASRRFDWFFGLLVTALLILFSSVPCPVQAESQSFEFPPLRILFETSAGSSESGESSYILQFVSMTGALQKPKVELLENRHQLDFFFSGLELTRTGVDELLGESGMVQARNDDNGAGLTFTFNEKENPGWSELPSRFSSEFIVSISFNQADGAVLAGPPAVPRLVSARVYREDVSAGYNPLDELSGRRTKPASEVDSADENKSVPNVDEVSGDVTLEALDFVFHGADGASALQLGFSLAVTDYVLETGSEGLVTLKIPAAKLSGRHLGLPFFPQDGIEGVQSVLPREVEGNLEVAVFLSSGFVARPLREGNKLYIVLEREPGN
ncbi:MAG: hypothetical protein PHC51_01350 [bacterium]|nr:hypothetical protein [bacterium]